MDQVDFKASRTANLLIGLGMLLIVAAMAYLTLFATEDEFLGTRTRRGGIIKLIEHTIGWELFVVCMLVFGAWAAAYAVVSFWKVLDGTPDVTAFSDHLEFHPAVRMEPARYDQISHWNLQLVSNSPVLTLTFNESYWSLQGIWMRHTMKLEGSEEQLRPMLNYFMQNEEMAEKYYNE